MKWLGLPMRRWLLLMFLVPSGCAANDRKLEEAVHLALGIETAPGWERMTLRVEIRLDHAVALSGRHLSLVAFGPDRSATRLDRELARSWFDPNISGIMWIPIGDPDVRAWLPRDGTYWVIALIGPAVSNAIEVTRPAK